MEQSIGVFGEELLLWMCVVRQSPTRPAPEHIHRQANILLDELKGSKVALELPVESVDDGMFAIAALFDEFAMQLPDLRPLWANHPLQATRWMTNNAGVELFQRLERVRQGPKSVFATYVTVLGLGFQGRYGLPGVDRYQLVQLRQQLALQIGSDPDRDWTGGVLKSSRKDTTSALVPKTPWFRTVWAGRGVVALVLVLAIGSLASVLVRNLG